MIENVTATGVAGIDSLVMLISGFINYVNIAIGGVFGLYVLLIFMRWREARALRRGMEDIKNEIRAIRGDVSVIETVSLKNEFEKNGEVIKPKSKAGKFVKKVLGRKKTKTISKTVNTKKGIPRAQVNKKVVKKKK